ncbi:serine protease Do-like HtrA [Lachnospiraceae bacterium]|nr:serine protease Do-like HtrA [Lachnospiraceae bacterium]
MYGNNYPNDYENRNVVDSTAREVKPETGNFSGQSAPVHQGGSDGERSYGSGGNSGSTYAGTSSYGSTGNTYGSGSVYNSESTHSSTGAYSSVGNMYGNGGNGYNGSYPGSSKPPKKEKKKGGSYWKKALAAISFGLLFGVFAGLGLYGVDMATGSRNKDGKADAVTDAAGEAAKGVKETVDDIAGADAKVVETADAEGKAVVMDVSGVASKVMPAIVSINNTYTQTMSYFGQTLRSESTAAGSGIIVGENDEELLIVSNYHVVENADKLIIQFVDGSEAEAQIKGSNPSMDLAVIAVPIKDVEATTKAAIAVATLGDSESLNVGEPAIAIGNALGYGQSVTLGVISALDRSIDVAMQTGNEQPKEDAATFIQTDAAINPGNSGGALLNIKGEVIGINSNKIGNTIVEGMGYAIPISAAKPIIEELMLKQTRTKVTESDKGYLGISPRTVAEEMTEIYGMPQGAYVAEVFEDTGADAAGIRKGNIITEFDGNEIRSAEDLLRVMEYYSVGESVDVTIMHGSQEGWESKTVTVTLGERIEN